MNIVHAPMLQVLDTQHNSLTEILAVLARDGGVIVHNMLSPQVVANLLKELAPQSETSQVGPKSDNENVNHFWGQQTKRFTRLAQRSQTFADEVLIHPTLTGVADELLKPSCASYWMNTGQMMIVMPGGAPQYMHRDSDDWPAMCSPTAPPCQISCMFALSDFTAENGATRVAPGSHLWSDYSRQAADDEITQAVMPAGSGMIYLGKTLHSAGANKTENEARFGMHLSYVLGWLTPEEAGCLGVTEDRAKTFTKQQQQLLGYRCYDASDINGGRLWTVDYEDVPVGLKW
ncbi:MAG: mitomycin antibiotic biosynthesis protein [Actinobacteria bacterium]|nr:MAG: mitomycin antibiotic biosynthesis protein [Actinomycetota bacterium]